MASRDRVPSPQLEPTHLLEQAHGIASQIRRAAVTTKEGSAVWLRSKPTPDSRPVALGPHIYGGTAGIAMFLAALDRVSGRDEHRKTVLAALAPLRRTLAGLLEDSQQAARAGLGLGGFVGLGSLLYAFLQIGSWLEEPDLLQVARQLPTLVTPESIAHDEHLDVVHGSAGAILALLALREQSAGPAAATQALAAATACGDHLLETRISWEERLRAWAFYPNLPPSSGFSHGAAGTCYALLHLYQATGCVKYLEAAQEGLAFERSLYSPEHRNWRDTRVTRPRYLTMWCHGAPGIVLGRLAGLDALDDAETRREIADGLATTLAVPLTDIDHLCCGNFGRADILLYAAQKLGDATLAAEAYGLARQALDRAVQTGRFGLGSADQDPANPTLFNGLAGIGYVLLRLACPGTLPCCLGLEPAPRSLLLA